jgi:hypothetical protein
VNERSVAECGEGGFEELVLRPPRGAVEADPATFRAIASLFDSAASIVEGGRLPLAGTIPSAVEQEETGLKPGLLKRLKEAAEKVRRFAAMAQKEAKGEILSPDEYLDILMVGRAAEHDFLVFKSLASSELALSTPEPLPKVADVAGSGNIGLLHVAAGAPLEFDAIVPWFGRKQVVKGSVYSYHEFVSKVPVSDATWRTRAGREPFPAWVEPFVSKLKLACPPKDPF